MSDSLSSALRSAAALAGLLVLTTACTYSHGDPAPCGIDPATVTYSGVVSPIFDRNCRACHGASVASTLGGNTNLGGYQEVKNYSATALLGSIEHTPGYVPMPKNASKLSECDIAALKAWFNAGAPNN